MNPVLRSLLAQIGTDQLSSWFLISGPRIDGFRRLISDPPIANDDGQAGPAHPYLILALLPTLLETTPFEAPAGVRFGVNYGMGDVRFLNPVPPGSEVRGRFTIADAFEKHTGQVQLSTDVSVEIQGQESPALTCRWITQVYT